MAASEDDLSHPEPGRLPPGQIDVVMTWVDGDDPAYRRLLNQYLESPEEWNPERFRNAHDTLRYSLRSVVKHLGPLLGKIFIVTQEPQCPTWLRRAAPGLELIHHASIFPDPSVLPTFSSNAIESCLHRIPDLRDWYFYFCDDYFLGQATGLEHLFSEDGRPYLRGTVRGEAWEINAWDFRHHPFAKFHHFPHLFYRPWAYEMEEAWEESLSRTRRRKFRRRPDLAPERLYRHFLLKEKRRENTILPLWRFLPEYRFHKLTNSAVAQEKALSRIAVHPPRFLCLNDDQGRSPHPQVGRCVHNLLETLFPHPSPFELS